MQPVDNWVSLIQVTCLDQVPGINFVVVVFAVAVFIVIVVVIVVVIVLGAQAVRFGYEPLSNSDPTPIWLDNLVCSGDENSLVDCRRNRIGDHNCNHDQDAGLVCSKGTYDNSQLASYYYLHNNNDVQNVFLELESVFETFLRGLMMAEMEVVLSDTAKEVESQNQAEVLAAEDKESTLDVLKELRDFYG